MPVRYLEASPCSNIFGRISIEDRFSSAPLSMWRVRVLHPAALIRMPWCFRRSKEAVSRRGLRQFFCNALSAGFIRADDGTVDKHGAGSDISVGRPTTRQDTDRIPLP